MAMIFNDTNLEDGLKTLDSLLKHDGEIKGGGSESHKELLLATCEICQDRMLMMDQKEQSPVLRSTLFSKLPTSQESRTAIAELINAIKTGAPISAKSKPILEKGKLAFITKWLPKQLLNSYGFG